MKISKDTILSLTAVEIGQMLATMVEQAKHESGATKDADILHRIEKLTESIQVACKHIDDDLRLAQSKF